MKKRIYSIIIAVVLMLSSIAAPTKVSALEIPYRVDVTKYTSDEANASAQIREQVKAHANTVTVYVRTKDKDLYAVFNRIWNNAFAETTNPDEGDLFILANVKHGSKLQTPLCVKRRETIHIIQNTQLM